MSDSSKQDSSPESPLAPDTEATPKAPAKKTVKKTAKKAAKKTVKKAAKKTAKKTAKKATKKVAKKTAKSKASETETLSTPQPSKQEPSQKESPQKETTQQESPQEKAPQSSPAPTPQPAPVNAPEQEAQQPSESQESQQPKMGRVKGLGPIPKKERNAQAPSSSKNNEEGQEHPRENRRGNRRNKNDRNQRNNNRNGRNNQQNRNNRNKQRRERPPKRPIVFTGDPIAVNGMLELAPKGFGFLRVPEKKFEQCQKDVFVPPDFVRTHGLRAGVWIHGIAQESNRGLQLTKIETINDLTPEEAFKLPHFEELKAINPTRRIAFETTPDRFTTRVLDIIAPVGRGQRGLIVSPPRSGKTTLLLHMAEAIQEKYDDSIHLIILLIDERPEEVTEFRRMLPNAEIYASSNDDPARNHARIAELCIERAKRLVEADKDVLILMDSITRLARAYNNGSGQTNHRQKRGKNRGYQSGGIVAGALEMPRRIFAAARNTRTAGSLTILATALIQTNSRADEAIFQEFKGTGNMELMLDRRIAEQYIYPAVDIFKSGTRREELIMADHLLTKINLIRRGLAGHRPEEAMERLLFFLKKFPNNTQMLMEIKG